MKFSTNEDVAAPIEEVFEMLCDFEAAERAAMRRGAEVVRGDMRDGYVEGMIWNAMFDWRGKRRAVQVKLVRLDRPNELAFESRTPGINGNLAVELIGLSRKRTRMRVALEVKPETVKGRILIQSLRLAKSRLTQRFKGRVADYARGLEERHASWA